jgi:integrase
MPKFPKKIEARLNKLTEQTGQHNAKLIREYAGKYLALPSKPSEGRCLMNIMRLKTISRLLENKALDGLTENNIISLNVAMRTMKSAAYYRRILRQFLRITDRKKFVDLLESDFMKTPRKKAGEGKTVNAERFWIQAEIDRYCDESKRYSPRQACWAGLWLSLGLRPGELLALTKNCLIKEPNKLVVKVMQGKTGSRTVVLLGAEAEGTWSLAEPHIKTLKDNEKVFSCGYAMMAKIHKKICKRAGIDTKNRDIYFYVGRRMALTKFYSSLSLPQAAQAAGHQIGSGVMRAYVGLKQSQIEGSAMPSIKSKTCPNPSCNAENLSPEKTQCSQCGSPLDRQKFGEIFEKNMAELVNTKLELFKKDLEIRLFKHKAKKLK